MIYLLLVWSLAGAPVLVAPVTALQPNGLWKCAGQCHTTGNADGGDCRTPLTSYNKPTEDACKADLASQCAKTKPPPGGCRLDDR